MNAVIVKQDITLQIPHKPIMNKQLIETIINSNNEHCPEFTYENPLLDRNVAKATSRSLVKILNLTQRSSKISDKLRHSILENIRKKCKVKTSEHNEVDETLMDLLTQFYSNNYSDKLGNDPENSMTKALDAFLLERIEDSCLTSSYKSEIEPDIIQSLINLEQNKIFEKFDVIHWDRKDGRYMCIMKELISKEESAQKIKMLDYISIKMIPEIEKQFLDVCYEILINTDSDINSVDSNNFLQKLIKISSHSPKCFQICYRILNFILIMSNYNLIIRNFISKFILAVKTNCSSLSFASLYQTHITHIVLLLDFNDEDLPLSLKEDYIKKTVQYLKSMQHNQENDFIMLLSHFPRWFELYFKS